MKFSNLISIAIGISIFYVLLVFSYTIYSVSIQEPTVEIIETKEKCCSIIIRTYTYKDDVKAVYELEYWDSKQMLTDTTIADIDSYEAIVEQYKDYCLYHHHAYIIP